MFHYYKPPADFSAVNPAPHVAHVAGHLAHTRDLLASIGKGLNFPPYYGKNFDAFWDCVRDLDVKERAVVVLHRDLPRIPHDDLETYLELLRDAGLYWENHSEEHSLDVWFPESLKGKVEAVMKKIPPSDPEVLE